MLTSLPFRALRAAGPVLAIALCPIGVIATDYTVTTVAGGALPATPAAALKTPLRLPDILAFDGIGNLYFIEDECVFKIDKSGTLTRVAGSSTRTGYSGDGGPALNASFSLPLGLAADASGNVFIADSLNNVIRRVDADGKITTVAGNGTPGHSGDGGPATSAQLYEPEGIAVDAQGDLYIADSRNNVLRKVANGAITNVAGTGESGYSGDGGPAASAKMSPRYLALDSTGNIYFTDGYTVRKISAAGGIISPIAGRPDSFGYSGDGGPATKAQLSFPATIAVDTAGNVLIADSSNGVIRRVSPDGIINTIAGGGRSTADGVQATDAIFGNAYSIALDDTGRLHIADYNRIRRVDSDGVIRTVAGTGYCCYTGDGMPATSARLNIISSVALDRAGNLYISDQGDDRIRRVSPDGKITTFAGTGEWGYSGDGGPAASATLHSPGGIAFDPQGNLYIADQQNLVVRKVTPDGVITTFAGNGKQGRGGDGGAATAAEFIYPVWVAADRGGNVYIADWGGDAIRRVDSAGMITRFANINQGVTLPAQLAIDSSGAVYDLQMYSVYVHSPTKNGYVAICCSATALAIDTLDNIWIADENVQIGTVKNQTFRQVAGQLTNFGYSGDGGPALDASFSRIVGLAVDPAGNVYVADNNVVRKLTPSAVATSPVLSVTKSHGNATFTPGQGGATWSISVANSNTAGRSTSGTITVQEIPGPGLDFYSMSGAGWTCNTTTCSRADPLAVGASYPAITVLTGVSQFAAGTVSNSVTVSGGGSDPATATDSATLSAVLTAPTLVSPHDGATDVALSPSLTWSAAPGATSYDVWLDGPTLRSTVANVRTTSYTPFVLKASTAYRWRIIARSNSATADSVTWSFKTVSPPHGTPPAGSRNR